MADESQAFSKYKVLIVRQLNQILDYTCVQQIMPRIFQFKLLGYRQEYPETVLPFDISDFIGTHILLCEESEGGYQPVLGFKSITLAQCDRHLLPFPIFGMLESHDNTELARKYFEQIQSEYRLMEQQEKIAYNGSFTIHPKLRANKAFMKELWPLSFGLLELFYKENHINRVVAVCATKFNIHKKKHENGWSFINHHSTEIPSYACKSLYGASLIPMELLHVEKLNSHLSPFVQTLWNQRLIYDLEHLASEEAA